MNKSESILCRLCLKPCYKYEYINQGHCKAMGDIFLTFDSTITSDHVICEICSVNLQRSTEFKKISLNMKYTYHSPHFCLFCKKTKTPNSFITLSSEDIDIILLKSMMEQYFPELNLHSIASLVTICLSCNENLKKLFEFIVTCLSTEQQIEKYLKTRGTSHIEGIDLTNIVNYTEGITEYNETDSFTIQEQHLIKEEPPGDSCSFDTKIEKEHESEECLENTGETSMKLENFIKCDIVKVEEPEYENVGTEIESIEEKYEIKDEEEIDRKDHLIDPTETVVQSYSNHNNSPSSNSLASKAKKSGIKKDRAVSYTKNILKNHICDSIERVVRQSADYYRNSISKTEDVISSKQTPSVTPENSASKSPRVKELPTKRPVQSIKKVKNIGAHKRIWWRREGDESPPRQPSYSKSELRTMISKVSIKGEKKYKCQVCELVIKAKCSMNRHMLIHEHPSERAYFYCNNCHYKTYIKSSLVNHMASHRSKIQTVLHECQNCTYTTKVKSQLEAHLVEHVKKSDD